MKSRFVSLALIALMAMLAGALGTTSAAEVKPINWGVLAVESQENLMKRWGPILEALEKRWAFRSNRFLQLTIWA